jgi:hypothetical protein
VIFTGPVFNWRRSGLDWDEPPYESSSPNLLACEADLRQRFGGCNMGIHFDKLTTKGDISEHNWGASLDWGTGEAQVRWCQLRKPPIPTGKILTLDEHFAAIDWVVAHSAELHIQSIVDIGRSWRADRVKNGASGWIKYASGYTGHAHLVTTFDGWDDNTPIAQRLSPPIPPQEDPMVNAVPLRFADTNGFFDDQVLALTIANPEQHAKLGIEGPPVTVRIDAVGKAAIELELGFPLTRSK